jgi:hypothetical protein
MIDYPGIVIPVHSFVDPVLDPVDVNFKPANERDAYIQSLCTIHLIFSSVLNDDMMLMPRDRFSGEIRWCSYYGAACV